MEEASNSGSVCIGYADGTMFSGVSLSSIVNMGVKRKSIRLNKLWLVEYINDGGHYTFCF